MFERFTDRARRVVVLSQEEARLLNHNYIGTEHLLLGLVAEHEGVAARALTDLGIDLESVRGQIVDLIGQGKRFMPGHLPFTPRAKKVLELSLRESRHLGHNYIGTEHVLLGLIREGEGVGARVIQELGLGLPDTRQVVIGLLSGSQETEGIGTQVPLAPEAVEEYPRLRRLLAGPEHDRIFAKSGSPYEARYGFSRGIRVGSRVEVAGTAPIPPAGEEVSPHAYDQMMRCGTIAIEALAELGASAADVIRTVMYITDPDDSDEVGRAHQELFGDAAPVATMVVVAGLLEPEWKVEIEVSAQL